MAQSPVFNSVGGMEIVKGNTYTSADLPTVPTTPIDTVKITEAPLIWRKSYNQDGTIEQENGTDRYVKGNQRGVWILIKRTTVTYPTGVNKNVPVLYKEGEQIAIHPDDTYTFLGECRIEYGNV